MPFDDTSHPDLRIGLGADHVAMIEIDRPPDNYLDVDLASRIADAFEQLGAEPRCRAIVLCSNGKNFCAGARLSPTADDLPTGDHDPLYTEVVRMFDCAVPIIAAVQGAAIGAGLGLALIADFRVAGTYGRFGATFSRLGFHHGFGLSVTLPRVVGEQRALEMLYTGRIVRSDEALGIGLCDRLVSGESAEVRDNAHELAREIAMAAPLAVRSIRRTMRSHLVSEIQAATRREHAEQQVLRRTDDYREGVMAAADRRTPNFTGR